MSGQISLLEYITLYIILSKGNNFKEKPITLIGGYNFMHILD